METLELIERISNGEDSYTQFKEQAVSSKDLAKEFVAFSNAEGGILIFGVADDGEIKGLSTDEIESLGQLIGNVADNNVKPPIHPLIQNMSIGDEKLIIVSIKDGTSKPYATASGDYYIKSSSDKKKISQEELRRLFAESKRLYADEDIVNGSDISDLNSEQFFIFLQEENIQVYEELKQGNLELSTVLENHELARDNQLTLAGNLIFGLNPQKFNKSFYIDCVYFDGDDISVSKFHSKEIVDGSFEKLYKNSIDFIKRNLDKKQEEEEFNSTAKVELDERVFTELIINAIVHRDYYINSSIKIFMFHNRIEIISPGKLTNSLTVEKIKSGISIHRNPILNSICKNVLPYSGYGSGIKRSLSINPNIEFINDIDKEEFKCIIFRT
ncbi:MAG: putative DNA binding domain-containing protein [Campylobacterota bacterium]|nr:putative DNA binding domain-containing protein [Campylobacterota bacterium]